jgi:hypothetical protein
MYFLMLANLLRVCSMTPGYKEAMIRNVSDKVKPYLRHLINHSRNHMSLGAIRPKGPLHLMIHNAKKKAEDAQEDY